MPVRRIRPTDEPVALAALTEVLCQAFEADAHINWIVRQDARRARAMRAFFRLLMTDLLGAQGEVYATDDLTAAAIGFPPGTNSLPLLAQARVAVRFASITGGPHLPLRAYGLNRMAARHPRQPHYFLQTIGVRPDLAGQGRGAALLAPILERCDQAGVPAYLETSRAANLGFYERHGFQVWATASLPRGPQLWQMLRPAASPSGHNPPGRPDPRSGELA
jgi:GNAT superfamily N-acetyltransferase